MAKKSRSFNMSATIREYRKAHPAVSANAAMDAIKKGHPGEKINEGTFRATFYKLSGAGSKKRTVRRKRRSDRLVAGGNDGAQSVMRAGLAFIRLAGGLENARNRLAGLEKLLEAAKAVE